MPRPYDVLLPHYAEPPASNYRRTLGLAGVSLWWGHSEVIQYLPLSDLVDIPQGHSLRHEIEGLAESLIATGFSSYGPRERVVIYVDHLGAPKIADGNHRLYVAKMLHAEGRLSGDTQVPVIISYRGNSDLRETSWVPRSKLTRECV